MIGRQRKGTPQEDIRFEFAAILIGQMSLPVQHNQVLLHSNLFEAVSSQ